LELETEAGLDHDRGRVPVLFELWWTDDLKKVREVLLDGFRVSLGRERRRSGSSASLVAARRVW